MVIERDAVVGTLALETIDVHLPQIGSTYTTRGMPDAELAGTILTANVVLYCEAFGHRNELVYYNRRNPPSCRVTTPHVHPIRGRR
jgi:hypothetical protein